MTLYRYRAGKEGTLHRGVVEASSPLDLKLRLQELGLSLITYSRTRVTFQDIFSLFSHKIKARTLMDFCVHLEQFENAGIPLKESLEDLTDTQENPLFKKILLTVLRDVERGVLFSKALAKHPSSFDSIFVGLISVGEKTGRLSFVLHHLITHLKWEDEVYAKIFKALRYPLIMAGLLFICLVILMGFFIPELVSFILSFRGELPLSTRILISVSSFLSENILLVLSGGGIAYALTVAFLKGHPKGGLWKSQMGEAFPLIGPLRRKLALSQFFHLFSIMVGGGVDSLQTLSIAQKSLGSKALKETLANVEVLVREGHTLSSAFERTCVFPPMVIRMIKVGEKTSSLEHNLVAVKEYFDTTLRRQVDHLLGLLEPLMLLIVGLIMGWIVIAVFLPLYETLTMVEY